MLPQRRQLVDLRGSTKNKKMSDLIRQIEISLENAELLHSKITDEIIELTGMTGVKTRHFYNNLCSFQDARYLEIGVWAGSSVCSAMCNNRMSCLCVDNWSEFNDGKNSAEEHFKINFEKFKGENNATFIEANCWDLNADEIGKRFKFNIYLYDGAHDEVSHYKALNKFSPCLDDAFIYLVDDWNAKAVVDGTNKSIADNNMEILFKKEIFTDAKDGWPHNDGDGSSHDWWNGIGIFVLEKSRNGN